MSGATTEAFTGLGGIVDEGIRYNPESVDFAAEVSLLGDKVKTMLEQYEPEEVGVMLVSFGEGLQIIQSSSQHDILRTVPWYGTDGNTQEQSIAEDPISSKFTNEVNFTGIIFGVSDNPKNQDVRAYLLEKLGRTPISYAYSSYDAVWLIGLSMQETQSTDMTDIKRVIIDVADNYSGAIGDIKLNEAGDLAISDYEIWKVEGTEWVLESQYDSANDVFVPVS